MFLSKNLTVFGGLNDECLISFFCEESGQFERTLLIADEDSYVSYLEGCTVESLLAGSQRVLAQACTVSTL